MINDRIDSSKEVKSINANSELQLKKFIKENIRKDISLHFTYQNDLSKKHGGVGLARKIGMDEALRRALEIQKINLPIVCLDADCTVSKNYLETVQSYFLQNPNIPGASINFEHAKEDEAIIYYELFLRYYVNALRFASFPYAYHTIGSSMAVQALEYAMEGGMNRRKAGEDFYFIHKIIPRGGFGEINNCTVFPSSRKSDRVPFGTGRAMIDYENNKEKLHKLYNFRIFQDLKKVLDQVDYWYEERNSETALVNEYEDLPDLFKSYFNAKEFLWQINEANENSSSHKTFLKRIFQWLDAFTLLKIIHHSRDNFYPNEDAIAMANALLVESKAIDIEIQNLDGLLEMYRKIDREGYLLDKMRNI